MDYPITHDSNLAAPVLVWFRQDLRLSDNPALLAACESGHPVICLYVFDAKAPGKWAPGGASRWWLHHSLAALSRSLKALGSQLVLRKGSAETVISELIGSEGIAAVYWNRCYEPHARSRDSALKARLKQDGIAVRSFNGSLLVEPWEVETKTGNPYKVFTPFWRAVRAMGEPNRPAPQADRLPALERMPQSASLDSLALLPKDPDWSTGFRPLWQPGEAGASERLERFLVEALGDYDTGRNLPGRAGTSGLSPHLHWGEISPRQIWHAVQDAVAAGANRTAADVFLSEIGWREFSHNLLYHFPDLPEANFQKRFDGFPWEDQIDALRAWRRGETGYPIVDAGMRQLWQTGWMHNRVRMITASFLIKHLMVDWRHGESWFWDTLVDADLAANSASWQWVAGSGADAAPYFRIFNPVTQGEKFDPEGAYVRQWVPELEHLPSKLIHKPWEADPSILSRAGVRLGANYPKPIVNHADARDRALAAFQTIKDAA